MRVGWGLTVLLLCACGGTPQQPADSQTAGSVLENVSMERPVDMQTVKADSGFVWLSNSDALIQRHLCVYSYEGMSLDGVELLHKRDSVMHRHVKGATDSIYQVTVHRSVSYALSTMGGTKRLKLSGLWQMEGDAMGGPFVCCAVVDSLRQRVVVADGFVYAPGRKKQDMMQRLTEIVESIKIKNK